MTATPEERIEELEAQLEEALDQIVDRDDTIDDLKRKNEALEEKVQNATDAANEMLRDLTR
jgi:FtsZ-binding cell division protein ZapB